LILLPASLGKEISSEAGATRNKWGIDFLIVRVHEEVMHYAPMIRIVMILGLFVLIGCAGCAQLKIGDEGSTKDQNHQAGQLATKPSKSATHGLIDRLTHPADFFHLFAREQPQQPKRAVALLTVGIIRTISNDGSYVIAELEPGIMVATGSSLLVTGNNEEPAHLKIAEITPPYFVAEIEHGHPEPGDLLKQ
jgi:hypothetical protein